MSRISKETLGNLKKGSETAFAEVVEKYRKTIFSICLKITKNRDFSEDLLSEIFTIVWFKSDSYQYSKGDFDKWIFAITYNHVFDFLRKQSRYEKRVVFDETIVLNSEEKLTAYDDKLMDLSCYMTNEEYFVFTCHILQKMKFKDIKEILNISEDKCKRLYYRAKKIAKEYFEKNR